ncbi:helix-turn-helix domain-containing protein [Pseudodesulfovibrio sp. F-1]|uniref:Helix-turn-helix domain-containing protein n=1 Tax=Pseudodesulfovibrio alkaliphilus TaxID=2661613 RepID=A0A7K1KS05_9BACT|nr:AraC family transcriptional regulator [Pseudodesulfovibrio alkaliphilus]MUM78879.1 helix-turn-helix domain-containing protein [Pseudodesulfovibrio alkaliphilus]
MLYDPLNKSPLKWNFDTLTPLSAYLAQTDALELAGNPVNVFMECSHGQLEGWICEPLEGVVLGTCSSSGITQLHKNRFHCDVPMMIFVLLLEGSSNIGFEQNPTRGIQMEKNMFSWGDWNGVEGVTEIPAQEQYRHISFSMSGEAVRRHFGSQTGEGIMKQLRQNLSDAGEQVTHISGLASPEIILAGQRLFKLPRITHLDTLQLKSASIEFVTKMMLNILECKARPTGVFAHQDIESIKELKSILESDVSRSGNIAELCSSIGMSRSKASAVFKHQYNTTIGQYQHSCRMIFAYDKLVSRQLNVSECAYELGYTNIGHFIAAFRRHYRNTPGQIYAVGKVASDNQKS